MSAALRMGAFSLMTALLCCGVLSAGEDPTASPQLLLSPRLPAPGVEAPAPVAAAETPRVADEALPFPSSAIEPQPASSSLSPPGRLDGPTHRPADPQALQQEKERRYQKLRQQIDALDERLRERNQAQAETRTSEPVPPRLPERESLEPSTISPPPAEIPAPDAAQLLPPPPAAEPMPPPARNDEPRPVAEPKPEASPIEAPEAAPAPMPFPTGSESEPPATLDADQTVIEGPVDRLGLADSLFATGETKLALDMYSQLSPSAYPPDTSLWIAFQIASCHRRLGATGEAEKRYREILAQHESGWIADLCRWWLTAMQDRTRLTANSQRLNEILQTLQTELDNELATSP